jgi:glycosyl hydrolase family 2
MMVHHTPCRAAVLALAVFLTLGGCAATAPRRQHAMDYERDSTLLNGTWEFLHEHADAEVWKPGVADGIEGWRPVELPGGNLGVGKKPANQKLQCVWLRRTFAVSAQDARRSPVLKWGRVAFGATAWINGAEVGSHVPSGPHTILVPKGVVREGRNEIVLRANGWGSLEKSKTGVPVMPVGADLHWGGCEPSVTDDIWLEFYGTAYIKYALAMPDLASKSVTFRIWLDSAGELPDATEVSVVVDGGRQSEVGPASGAGTVTGRQPVNIAVKLDSVQPWTPETPFLYEAHLRASAGGGVQDDMTFRFGMREIGLKAGHYRLNARPLWFRGSNLVHEWTWGGAFDNEVERYLVDEARAMNLNVFRTHTMPPDARWLEVADRRGMMFLAEFAVTYNYRDCAFTPKQWETFHRNTIEDARSWMTKIWNHPSVVMWVLTNEPRPFDAQWEAGPYHRFARELDPTRPCLRAGTPVLGTESAIDIHSCSNYCFYPEGQLLLELAERAKKRDPKRALCNSEYMNHLGNRREIVSRRLGRRDHPYRAQDYAECAMEHTEAMRRLQYDMILPYMYAGWPRFRKNNWRADYPTPMAAALQSSMAPVLASVDLFNRNYVVGAEVTTRLHFINELPEDVAGTVTVHVTPQNPLCVPDADALAAAVSRQEFEHEFKGDTITTTDISFKVPPDPGMYWLAVVLERPGVRAVVSQRTIRAYAAPTVPDGLERGGVHVVGKAPLLRKWLAARGIAADAPAARVMLVADAAVPAADDAAGVGRLRSFAEAGGRAVLMVDGTNVRDLPFDLQIAKGRSSSRVFLRANVQKIVHASLDGIDPEGLKCWNGLPGVISDNFLAGQGLRSGVRVLWGDTRSRIVLFSLPMGEGEIVVSLLRIPERLDPAKESYDPVAEELLLNMLNR